jgi:hypothetical protein
MKTPVTSGFITDAPSDSSTYGRKNAAWNKVLNLTDGGTVAGPMTFSGVSNFSNTVGFSGTVNFTGAVTGLPSAPIYRSYLAGLVLSSSGPSTTFSVAAGQAVDSTNVLLMALASAMSKTTSAWAAGSGNGGMDTGSVAINTWYHVYLIANASGSTVDVLFSLSASAPTLPGGYTLFRRIGSMKTNGSSQWTPFLQNGDRFSWVTPVLDVNGVTLTTTASTLTLPSCPTGVVVTARLNVAGAPAVYNYFSALNTADMAPASAAAPGASSVSETVNFWYSIEVELNTSAQLRGRGFASVSSYVVVFGWWDRRGRDA